MEAITISQQTVNTQEEYNALKASVEQAGGRIMQSIPLRGSAGLSVIIEMPTLRRSV